MPPDDVLAARRAEFEAKYRAEAEASAARLAARPQRIKDAEQAQLQKDCPPPFAALELTYRRHSIQVRSISARRNCGQAPRRAARSPRPRRRVARTSGSRGDPSEPEPPLGGRRASPAIVILLELEGRPAIRVDCVTEGERDRLADWIGSQPDLLALLASAYELSEAEA